ncbi:MAG: hypothetical protein V1834_02780 [Candidatus Micrarchaeota archaeon]
MKKLVLFLAVLALMLPNVYASADGKTMKTTMQALTPFMNLDESDYSVSFDYSRAKISGLSANALRLGKNYERFHNQVISSVMRGTYPAGIDSSLSAEFEPMFRYVAETGDMISASSPISINKMRTANALSFDSFVPSFTRRLSYLVCGGDQQHPHKCPTRVNTGIYKSTLTEMQNYLKSAGYHNTYWPGCGIGGYPCQYDFSKTAYAYGCNGGQFRNQANIAKSGSKWTYSWQSPEPNPEIFSYSWPVYWWGTYVNWWHNSYC